MTEQSGNWFDGWDLPSGQAIATVEPPKVEPAQVENTKSKRSNPAYTPTTVYIEREVQLECKRILIREDFDLSDLVNNLLNKWVLEKWIEENANHSPIKGETPHPLEHLALF